MTDFEKIKQEFANQYPGITDGELCQMVRNLIEAYNIAVNIVLEEKTLNLT